MIGDESRKPPNVVAAEEFFIEFFALCDLNVAWIFKTEKDQLCRAGPFRFDVRLMG